MGRVDYWKNPKNQIKKTNSSHCLGANPVCFLFVYGVGGSACFCPLVVYVVRGRFSFELGTKARVFGIGMYVVPGMTLI